jgi:RNA polymerase sigma factor (sigma-70 family)
MEDVRVESALGGDQAFGGPMLKRVAGSATGPLQGQVAAPAVVAAAGQLAIDALFDDMFARYHGAIYGYILGMVGSPEQAQDLAQDTFVKAYKALPGTRDLALPAWLYRIATNTALDALRHRRRLTWLPFAPGDDDRIPAPELDLPTRLAEHEAVRHALARLTPPQRACLLLRARDGLSIDEIAHALGMSKGNVKITLYRAKERFRAAYSCAE